jgi:hypothetical protein
MMMDLHLHEILFAVAALTSATFVLMVVGNIC